jgi:voltage-gated potassium channel
MDTRDPRQQIRLALIVIAIIVPLGIIGFMVLEGLALLDSIWLTVITLATIGYGDVYAKTDGGRIFTIFLIIVGLASFGFAIQAGLVFVFSPEVADLRRKRRSARRINQLQGHYIICGEGELVNKTISYLLRRTETAWIQQQRQITQRIDSGLDRVFGRHNVRLRPLRHTIRRLYLLPRGSGTMLDTIVVITQDTQYAKELRATGVFVVEGDSSDDNVLRTAGVKRAQALMVLSHNDTETLLTTLAAHSRNASLFITATVLQEQFAAKMLRVGANTIIKPYEVAGQFLNNATFRPTVNDFFNTILFDIQRSGGAQTLQLALYDDSPWIGKTLEALMLKARFGVDVIGIRREDGSFAYAPEQKYRLAEDEVVVAVAPSSSVIAITQDCRPDVNYRPSVTQWQRLPDIPYRPEGKHIYSPDEVQTAVAELSQHYIICSGGLVAQNAIDKLNPERAFVIISNYETQTQTLLARGFRVIHGDPSDDHTLLKAGITRALAMMISLDDKALSVITTLTSRTLSKTLLITATADSDDMVVKLRRAGADRVISPFRIAAQFVLLGTLRPIVSDFLQYVLFNYQNGLETTELYMESDSPWIGKTIGELYLGRIFHAGVLGIRLDNGRYIYNPPDTYRLKPQDIMIVTVPMNKSDLLRELAHGTRGKRTLNIRRDDWLKTSIWTV